MTHVYKGAALKRTFSRHVLRDDGRALRVTVELYAGYKSHGYRSNYGLIPCRWLALEALSDGVKPYRRVTTYTGKRYDKAESDYSRILADLEAAPAAGGAP